MRRRGCPKRAYWAKIPSLRGLQAMMLLRESSCGEGLPGYLVDVPLSWLLCSSDSERAGVRWSRHQGKRVSEQDLSAPAGKAVRRGAARAEPKWSIPHSTETVSPPGLKEANRKRSVQKSHLRTTCGACSYLASQG